MSAVSEIATWDAAAKERVRDVWVFHNATVLQGEGSLGQIQQNIRTHLDNLIDAYFGKNGAPEKHEWVVMCKYAILADNSLTEDEMWRTLCAKQNDYGPNNIARFGQSGVLLRMHDKVARMENLISNGRTAENESLHDTYLDIVGYSIIGMMLDDSSFFLPMGDDWRK